MTHTSPPTNADGRSSMPAALVSGICQRDFEAIERLLAPDAQLRAVLPSRFHEAAGTEIVDTFRRWFAGADELRVIDADSRETAGRTRVSWHLRATPHPVTGDPGWHEVEQVAFCDASVDGISRIDLTCTGFHAER
jgi:hypothetical protein